MYYLVYNQLHVNNDISMETTITNRIEVNCTECGKVINKKEGNPRNLIFLPKGAKVLS